MLLPLRSTPLLNAGLDFAEAYTGSTSVAEAETPAPTTAMTSLASRDLRSVCSTTSPSSSLCPCSDIERVPMQAPLAKARAPQRTGSLPRHTTTEKLFMLWKKMLGGGIAHLGSLAVCSGEETSSREGRIRLHLRSVYACLLGCCGF
jgi:hypothetical protein